MGQPWRAQPAWRGEPGCLVQRNCSSQCCRAGLHAHHTQVCHSPHLPAAGATARPRRAWRAPMGAARPWLAGRAARTCPPPPARARARAAQSPRPEQPRSRARPRAPARRARARAPAWAAPITASCPTPRALQRRRAAPAPPSSRAPSRSMPRCAADLGSNLLEASSGC